MHVLRITRIPGSRLQIDEGRTKVTENATDIESLANVAFQDDEPIETEVRVNTIKR